MKRPLFDPSSSACRYNSSHELVEMFRGFSISADLTSQLSIAQIFVIKSRTSANLAI
jgi:hypothetical protein